MSAEGGPSSANGREGANAVGVAAWLHAPAAHLIAVTALVAAAAWLAGLVITPLGPAVCALLIGSGLRTRGLVGSRVPGLSASKLGTLMLQLSIVALGFTVDIPQVLGVAQAALPVMVGTLVAGLGSMLVVGSWLGVPDRIRTMLAAGTSICGASAVTAVGRAIGAAPMEMAYAISIVFSFNVVAIVLFPIISHALGLTTSAFGIWAGTAVNDTSSVLAVGYAFGQGAATYAAVVKLSRTLMIVPVTLVLGLAAGRLGAGEGLRPAIVRAFPRFMLVFVAATALRTVGFVPSELAQASGTFSQISSVVALAAIGVATDLRAVRAAGPMPIILGLIGWVIVALTSLALQATMGLL